MSEITTDQERQVEAAAEQFAGKLRAFHEGLTPDEQTAFEFALQHISTTDESEADVSGYATNVEAFLGQNALVRAATLGFVELVLVPTPKPTR